MFESQTLDDFAARIRKAFDTSPAKDLDRNLKALLQSGLSRLDVVTRAEFELQREVLARTREKLEALEARVAALEAGPGAAAGSAAGHRRAGRGAAGNATPD